MQCIPALDDILLSLEKDSDFPVNLPFVHKGEVTDFKFWWKHENFQKMWKAWKFQPILKWYFFYETECLTMCLDWKDHFELKLMRFYGLPKIRPIFRNAKTAKFVPWKLSGHKFNEIQGWRQLHWNVIHYITITLAMCHYIKFKKRIDVWATKFHWNCCCLKNFDPFLKRCKRMGNSRVLAIEFIGRETGYTL